MNEEIKRVIAERFDILPYELQKVLAHPELSDQVSALLDDFGINDRETSTKVENEIALVLLAFTDYGELEKRISDIEGIPPKIVAPLLSKIRSKFITEEQQSALEEIYAARKNPQQKIKDAVAGDEPADATREASAPNAPQATATTAPASQQTQEQTAPPQPEAKPAPQSQAQQQSTPAAEPAGWQHYTEENEDGEEEQIYRPQSAPSYQRPLTGTPRYTDPDNDPYREPTGPNAN